MSGVFGKCENITGGCDGDLLAKRVLGSRKNISSPYFVENELSTLFSSFKKSVFVIE